MSNFYRELNDRQELSKTLFGRTDRVDVWEALLGLDPPIFRPVDLIRHLEEASSVPRQSTIAEVRLMLEVGMVETQPRRPDDPRSTYYQRTDSPLWGIAAATIQAFNALQTPPEVG